MATSRCVIVAITEPLSPASSSLIRSSSACDDLTLSSSAKVEMRVRACCAASRVCAASMRSRRRSMRATTRSFSSFSRRSTAYSRSCMRDTRCSTVSPSGLLFVCGAPWRLAAWRSSASSGISGSWSHFDSARTYVSAICSLELGPALAENPMCCRAGRGGAWCEGERGGGVM